MVRPFLFTCLPRAFLTGWASQFCCRCWLVEAEYSFGYRASACPLECRDGREGVRGYTETLGMSQMHYLLSLICHSPSFFSLPLSHLLHEISFSLVSGETVKKSQGLFLPLVIVILKIANIPQVLAMYPAQNYFHITNELMYKKVI